ncbi:MAG TPA: hypothetical protein VME68_15710 [Acidobacteriaceae bacterium]|nr:hypothetical protein [Acidobacteriaceae bacterium]
MNQYLSTLLATMVALSVAVERVVEILKQFCGTWPVAKLLFTTRPTQGAENARCAWMYVLSGSLGAVLSAYTGAGAQILPHSSPYLADVVAGLLASGGSSFWNHALDMMQATKVVKEQAAAAVTQANAAIAAAVAAPVAVPVSGGD